LSGLLLGFLLLGIFSCQKDDDPKVEPSVLAKEFSSDVPLEWYRLLEQIDRYSPGYRPPAAARMLAYTGLAAYEAAVPGMPDYNSLANQYPGLALPETEANKKYHWPSAVNAAFHVMFVKNYPHIEASDKLKIENLNQAFEDKYAGQLDADVFTHSKAFGEAVANAIYEWSKTDAAGHEAFLNPHPSSYTPPAGDGLWQPTFPDYTPALFPYWGQVRPFAMKNDDLLAKPPLPWSNDPNSQLYQQAKETQVWVDNIKAGLDDEGLWIAEFWSDDIFELTFEPAVRQIAIANQVVAIEKPSLETALELYAKMGMALCDAGIAIWNSKYVYKYERPIHYIRRNFDPNWTPLLDNPIGGYEGITPPFPAYPSGHSGFGGAGASVLTDIFGYHYTLTDNCHKGRVEFRGEPRTFYTFIDMAVENAYSRLPLGVHFRMDCDEGLRLGYLAGQRVAELPWKK
jgi:hypothetical protein